MDAAWSISVLIFLLVLVVILTSAVQRMLHIGFIAAVVVIVVILVRPGGTESIGLVTPDKWSCTVLQSVILGTLISFLFAAILEPAIEWLTGSSVDISLLDPLRGNRDLLLRLLFAAWIGAAFVEEVIFRGFLMNEFEKILGSSSSPLGFSLLITSALFGLSHLYQGPSGVVSTGIAGAILGGLYVWSGYNLWMPILTHGIIDTMGLILIFTEKDQAIKHLFFRGSRVEEEDITDPR